MIAVDDNVSALVIWRRGRGPCTKARVAQMAGSPYRGRRSARSIDIARRAPGLDYERGKLAGEAEVYEVPPSVDVCEIRSKTGLSEAEFANRYGFNRRSLQDWEQGRRMPDSAARPYLLVISHNPAAVEKALFRKAS